MSARYAIYFAPGGDTPWWEFGAGWLGHEGRRLPALEQLQRPQLGEGEFERITASPRHYGFHATLKAPFRLTPGISADVLLERVHALARSLDAVPLGTLVPVFMDGFVALVPPDLNPALNALAEACVAELDDLRAPLTPADLDRRRPDQLDKRGRELLDRFGYPHVMERFSFHMTLTGPVDTATAGQVVAQVARPVAQLNADVSPVLDRLCIFVEHEPAAPFRRMADALLRT